MYMRALLITLLFFQLFACSAKNYKDLDWKEGDIVFQNSQSPQCEAIKLATHSNFTHCGIVFLHEGEFQVLEAVQPIRWAKLDEWINRAENQTFVVKRLKNRTEILTSENINRMVEFGSKWIGKNYDAYFSWTDERIYCSELVWKIYKNVLNIELGKLDRLDSFDLSSLIVKKTMRERYGNQIPYDEKVISPAAIESSELLETITFN